MKKIFLAPLLAFALLFAFRPFAHAQPASTQETLNQYISDLQKNPNDNALREKIIRHVQTMKPAPVIPEEARRNYVMAKTLFKEAKNVQDYNDALAKFKTALLLAPWWAEAYLDMGLGYEAAQQYAEAINALKLYVVANPDSEKSRKAQDEIYIIEAKKEKAEKDKQLAAKKAVEEKRAQQEDAEAKKAKEQEGFLKKINGARYLRPFHNAVSRTDGYGALDVLGDTITVVVCTTRAPDSDPIWKVGVEEKNGDTYKIDGRTLRGFSFGKAIPWMTGVIADDGSTITIINRDSNGEVRSTGVFKRER